MKKLTFTLFATLLFYMGIGQTTYYWVGGTAPSLTSFNTSSYWNTVPGGGGTARTTAAATDILIFDGTDVSDAAGIQTGQIVFSFTTPTAGTGPAQLKFTSGADVVFKRSGSGGTTTLTVGTGNALDNDPDLVVTSGSKLTIAGTTGSLLLVTDVNATAEISGDVAITEGNSTQQNRITARTSRSFRFLAGSTFTTSAAYAYYPFSTTGSSTVPAANGVVFESGSSYYYYGGNSPFGSSSTSFLVEFKPGSKFYFRGANATNMFSGRSYADVVVDNNTTVTADGSLIRMDSLRVETGSTYITHTSGSTPIHGNIVNRGTIRVPAANPDRDNKIILAGSSPQTISGTGTYTLADLVISNVSNVSLQRTIQVDTLTRVIGMLNATGYTITGSGTTSIKSPATLTVTGNTNVDSFIVKNISDLTGIEVGMSVSGTGIQANTVVINTSSSSNTITLSKPVTGTSTYAGAAVTLTVSNGQGVLPVKFVSFSAFREATLVKLTWEVATEENLRHYIVESSPNGIEFKSIGTVNAEKRFTYNYNDRNAAPGRNYYRIKAVDIDGNTTYTSIIKLDNTPKGEISVAPNPVKGKNFTLSLTNLANGNYTLTLVNAGGQKILVKNLGNLSGSITTNVELPQAQPGVYTLVIGNGEERIMQRIVIH